MNSELRLLQESENEILRAFVSVCEKNSLSYYLSYGTLLGAKRHCGFIPWDDDIDVAMPREDYDIFCNRVYSELPHGFKFRSFYTDGTYDSYVPRIENDSVIMTDMSGHEYYSWIDIFPIDGLPPANSFSNRLHKIRLMKRRILINIARMSTGIDFNAQKRGKKEKFILAILRILNIGKLINHDKQYKQLDKELKKYDAHKTGNCVDFLGEKFKDECPISYYGQGRKLLFEGSEMQVPVETEKILKLLYGDYMQLPPEEQRNVHNLKSVRKNNND